MMLAFRGLDMVRAPPVPGSYLKIEALKMKLRILEGQLQGDVKNTHPQCLTAPMPALNCRIAIS